MRCSILAASRDGTFTPTHVQLGLRRQDVVEIVAGLKEGDQVATGAAFFLDSESQLRAGTSGYEPSSAGAPATAAMQPAITLRALSDPVKAGDNTFEVSVKDPAGRPIADADVVIQLFMPAMPTMSMPAVKNSVKALPIGSGVYRGTGEVVMAGRWDVTVSVSRGGQPLGSLQTTLVAR